MSETMKQDPMTSFDAARLAERLTPPLEGARIHGDYISGFFLRKRRPSLPEFRRQPDAVRFVMLRPPCDIWNDFKTKCIRCLRDTKRACSGCHVTRYCGLGCQRE